MSVYTPILSVYTLSLSVYTLVFGWCVSQLVFLKLCNWLLTGLAYIRSVWAYIRCPFERIYAPYGRIYAQMYLLSLNRQPWIAHFRYSESRREKKNTRTGDKKNTWEFLDKKRAKHIFHKHILQAIELTISARILQKQSVIILRSCV